jgi:hypothetical protein
MEFMRFALMPAAMKMLRARRVTSWHRLQRGCHREGAHIAFVDALLRSARSRSDAVLALQTDTQMISRYQMCAFSVRLGGDNDYVRCTDIHLGR